METGRIVSWWDVGLRLPFNGKLSEEEERLVHQGWYKPYPASWEDDLSAAIDRAIERAWP